MKEKEKEFHSIIEKTLRSFIEIDDEVGKCVKATLFQFLCHFKKEILQCVDGKSWVSYPDVFDCQIIALRECILDLNKLKLCDEGVMQ